MHYKLQNLQAEQMYIDSTAAQRKDLKQLSIFISLLMSVKLFKVH